jgi:DNA-binding NarL/FixJ family response regulator
MERLLVALYFETTMPEYPWPSNSPLHERNREIIDAYRQGKTLEHIATALGISIARVHQIIKHNDQLS